MAQIQTLQVFEINVECYVRPTYPLIIKLDNQGRTALDWAHVMGQDQTTNLFQERGLGKK